MSEGSEGAKAVQEVAKLGQDVMASLESVERIGGQILGPFGQAYGILTDIVQHKREEIRWRLENRRQVYEAALVKARSLGLELEDLKAVPLRVAYDYEAAIEREDNGTLQDLWANLLVNVCKPTNPTAPEKIYSHILASLDERQAAFFNEIGDKIL